MSVIAMFIAQAIGITVEDVVIRLCGPAIVKFGGRWKWWRLIGFAWVLGFELVVGPWFHDPFFRAIKAKPVAQWSVVGFAAGWARGVIERYHVDQALVGS